MKEKKNGAEELYLAPEEKEETAAPSAKITVSAKEFSKQAVKQEPIREKAISKTPAASAERKESFGGVGVLRDRGTSSEMIQSLLKEEKGTVREIVHHTEPLRPEPKQTPAKTPEVQPAEEPVLVRSGRFDNIRIIGELFDQDSKRFHKISDSMI